MEEDAPESQGGRLQNLQDMDQSLTSSDEEDHEESMHRLRFQRELAASILAQPSVASYPLPPSILMDDSSDEERQWGGSLPGKAPNKTRNFELAKETLIRQYFSGDQSTFDEEDFERRFRMPRSVFVKVKDAVIGEPPFIQTADGFGKPGIDPLVRLTACLRKLAYGTASDAMDEKFEMSESVLNRDFPVLCKIVKDKFGKKYLNNSPTPEVMAQIQQVNAGRGFPGMFASWDCKHFPWEMCPVALQGQYKSGKEPHPSIVLEAICDPHLYIWYHHFGEPGSLNDINILDKSSILLKILNSSFDLLTPEYRINNATRNYLYFLVDGIYPQWAIFMDTFSNPLTEKETHFAKMQEGCRKDIERAFGVLVKRWRILQNPIRKWYLDNIKDILDCCIIFHNMVVEHYRDSYTINDWAKNQLANEDLTDANLARLSIFGTDNLGNIDQAPLAATPQAQALRGARMIENFDDAMAHASLKADLVEHLWKRKNDGF